MVSGEEQSFHLIAGLGNPGREYCNTRHNAGFMAVDALAKIMSGKSEEKEIPGGLLRQFRCRGGIVSLVKPVTYMNLSGTTVASFMRKKGIDAKGLLLVYDDMDLPLGRLRFCIGGGSAGHKGVGSVISEIGTEDFARLRIGIGRKSNSPDKADYVLSEFSESEKELFSKVIDMAAEAVKLSLYRGLQKAMNGYNGRFLGESSDNNKTNMV
ncbi:MAG: aminoacyl-tRNA hydrolase [Victivallales bacterium]|jgi:PTH1 family peptidyl-tRNA hydrolase